MRRGVVIAVMLAGGTLAMGGFPTLAGTPEPAAATPTPLPTRKAPVFMSWLKPDDPGDQVIRVYWKKVEAGTATPEELVDLGTMLFYRGYPKDAVRMYKRALKEDGALAEAWFRIGTVYHVQRKFAKARRAYRKCIKRFPGHGWCNFFLGLCDEQLGYTTEAIHYYQRAYRFAPELMDPEVNPAVLYSHIQVSARVPTLMKRLVTRQLPLDFLEKEKVSKIRSQFEPTPTPSPEPTATPRPSAKRPQKTPAAVRPRAATPVVRPRRARPTPRPRPSRKPVPPAKGQAGAPGTIGGLPQPPAMGGLRPLGAVAPGSLKPLPQKGPVTPTPTPKPDGS